MSQICVTVSRCRIFIVLRNMAMASFLAASFGDARHRRYKAAATCAFKVAYRMGLAVVVVRWMPTTSTGVP